MHASHRSLHPTLPATRPASRRGGTVLFVCATALLAIVHETVHIGDLHDQAAAAGYSSRMVNELDTLFPRPKSVPAELITTQGADLVAMADQAKTRLESKVYDAILSGLRARAYEPANIFVVYVGRMRMKVVVSVRAREMPYPKIRATLRDLRQMSEEVLHETFPAMTLAELSTFTVLNRRNGKVYEYPVLYQSVRLQPAQTIQPDEGPFPRPRIVPLPALPTKAAVGLEASPAPSAAPSPAASGVPSAMPSSAPSPTPSASPGSTDQGKLPAPLLRPDGYTVDDFYGDISVGHTKLVPIQRFSHGVGPHPPVDIRIGDEPLGNSRGSSAGDFDAIDLEPTPSNATGSSKSGRH